MDRRNFFSRIGAAAATTAAVELKAEKKPAKTQLQTVNYSVKGFTCITCAVGLETMLRGLKGVSSVKASYPGNTVAIEFDARLVGEDNIKKFIAVCGFSVA